MKIYKNIMLFIILLISNNIYAQSKIEKNDTISGISGKTIIHIDEKGNMESFEFTTEKKRITQTQINRFISEFVTKHQIWTDLKKHNNSNYYLKYKNDGVQYNLKIYINNTLKLKQIKLNIKYD